LTDKAFLKKSKIPHKTETLLAPSPAKFLRMVENQFVVAVQRKKITDVEFEVSKNKHLEDADTKQIILCLNLMQSKSEVYLVTEETAESNDNKLFKKIPAMCNELNIKCITLPQLLKIYENEINVLFKK
jgi:hypothetical protein